MIEKTIHAEETSNTNAGESMADLKVRPNLPRLHSIIRTHLGQQSKLEAQYSAKREAHAAEINDLKQQLEQKSNDIRLMNNTVETLKGVNDELKVSLSDMQLNDLHGTIGL
jgi:kinesin family protein 5